jgi:hypothetical protein
MVLCTEDNAKIRGVGCNILVLTLINYNVLCKYDLGWSDDKVEKGPECLGNVTLPIH